MEDTPIGIDGKVVYDDESIEIKRIVIRPGYETRPHSHGESNGHTFVVEGIAEIETYDLPTRKFIDLEVVPAGECCRERSGTIHIVKNTGLEILILVNITKPPLRDNMVFYDKSELIR